MQTAVNPLEYKGQTFPSEEELASPKGICAWFGAIESTIRATR